MNATMIFPPDSPYRRLARALDGLPNRFPPAEDESDLRLLAYLFTPAEAETAAGLSAEPETAQQIAARLGVEAGALTEQLKGLARRGLISLGRTAEGRPGFCLMPFVVGFYENQRDVLDAELARLVEDYFHTGMRGVLAAQPALHRVVPVGEAVRNDMEVYPYESATALVEAAEAWANGECICRKQKALVGEPCGHPLDLCLAISSRAGAFDGSGMQVLDKQGALDALKRASEAGLVHTVSNNRQEVTYICNCCTCSCGILRGMTEMGIANVVARSAFVCAVDEALCLACGECQYVCSFKALELKDVMEVTAVRCVGCGLCVPVCPNGALALVRRTDALVVPETEAEWGRERVENK